MSRGLYPSWEIRSQLAENLTKDEGRMAFLRPSSPTMDRETAYSIVREYVKNEGLIKHMLSVEAAMRGYAVKFGEDADYWALAGLLHDFDWEIHPSLDHHPQHPEPCPAHRRAA